EENREAAEWFPPRGREAPRPQRLSRLEVRHQPLQERLLAFVPLLLADALEPFLDHREVGEHELRRKRVEVRDRRGWSSREIGEAPDHLDERIRVAQLG